MFSSSVRAAPTAAWTGEQSRARHGQGQPRAGDGARRQRSVSSGPSGFLAARAPGRQVRRAVVPDVEYLRADIADGKLKPLTDALATIDSPIKLALFDDTWTWGQPFFGDFWKHKPDLTDPDRAARTIYEAKWKPFFSQIDKKYWYRFAGRPFIYFYNAGTLEPRSAAAPVIAKAEGAVQG